MSLSRRGVRARGGALLIVVILAMVVLALTGLLIALPKQGLDREVFTEQKESAFLAADAGLREAVVGLDNKSITVPASPAVYSAYSATTPKAFGRKGGGYWYTLEQVDGTHLKVDAWGSFVTSITGSGQTKTVNSHIEALLKISVPMVNFPGAYTLMGKSPPPTVNYYFDINGRPNTVTGVDGAGGSPVLGVSFDSSLAGSTTVSASVSGATLAGSFTGTAPGSAPAGAGGSMGYANASTLASLFTTLRQFEASPPSTLQTTGGTITDGTPYGTTNQVMTTTNGLGMNVQGNVTIGSPANPALTIVRPTGAQTAGDFVNFDGTVTYTGIIYMDLRGVTNFNTGGNGISLNGFAKVNGIVLVDLPTAAGTPVGGEQIYQSAGNNNLQGGLAVMVNNTYSYGANGLEILQGNGNTALTYNSNDIAIALRALGGGNYVVQAYRVVQ